MCVVYSNVVYSIESMRSAPAATIAGGRVPSVNVAPVCLPTSIPVSLDTPGDATGSGRTSVLLCSCALRRDVTSVCLSATSTTLRAQHCDYVLCTGAHTCW